MPLIDHNPRRGTKIEFSPAEAIRYNERTAAERSNARLKDEFGGKNLRVRGDTKVMAHLMFGIPGAVRAVDAITTMTPSVPSPAGPVHSWVGGGVRTER